MKKTLKLLIFGSLPLLLLIIILSCIDIIKTDFKYAHQSFNTYQDSFNWFSYRVKTNVSKSFINFKKSTKIGLPIKHIYLKEKFNKEFLEKTPDSIKKWKEALLINNNGSTDKIEIRLKGDNPGNWFFLKKHWKIKKRKKNLTERQRYFEYLPFDFEIYLSGKLASSLKLISPSFKLVELFLNDESKGIYIETETLNEGFLRRNKIMPVNLYKGEQILSEKIIGIEVNLLNSPGALKKISYFNQVEKDDKSDLRFLSNTIQLAHNNNESYSNLIDLIDLKYWANFISYQILTQNFHNDYFHNFRMISDPWTGKFTPIVYDPLLDLSVENRKFDFDRSSNELFVLLNQNSYFQNLKFERLNFILNSNVIENEIIKSNLLDEKIKISEARDVEILSKDLNVFSLFSRIFSNKKKSNISYNNKKIIIKKLKLHTNKIQKFLTSEPRANWYNNENGFDIYINSILPVADLNFFFKDKKPKWIALDINENGIVDKNELKFNLNKDRKIIIPYRFYANRIPIAKDIKNLSRPELKILPTRFRFISADNIKPNKIDYKNPFSKKKFELIYKNQSSFPISKYNKPIITNSKIENKIILEGIVNINEMTVYDNTIEIKAGTTFYIDNGASIIFKNKLIALGTKENPILFIKRNIDDWGTVALQGEGTQNSILNNIFFDGGSGHIYRNIKYTGALSIHDTKNVIIKNVNMKNNKNYDDMIHIVYVDNIRLENIQIKNSFMDGIDIDMSTQVVIKNVTIDEPGNDGIDLMESDAIISEAKIYKAIDKAISVGENSFLILNNSLLSENNIGIATKDKSFSFVNSSNFIGNKLSVSNYKKNWQYADGGVSMINSSKLSNKDNISVDKHSTIHIVNSSIGNINIDEKTIAKKKNKNHLLILKKNDYEKISKKLKKSNINISSEQLYGY